MNLRLLVVCSGSWRAIRGRLCVGCGRARRCANRGVVTRSCGGGAGTAADAARVETGRPEKSTRECGKEVFAAPSVSSAMGEKEGVRARERKGRRPPFKNGTVRITVFQAGGMYVWRGLRAGACFYAEPTFNFGCGWPGFYCRQERGDPREADAGLPPFGHEAGGKVTARPCGGHLGHIFDDAPPNSRPGSVIASIRCRQVIPRGGDDAPHDPSRWDSKGNKEKRK